LIDYHTTKQKTLYFPLSERNYFREYMQIGRCVCIQGNISHYKKTHPSDGHS